MFANDNVNLYSDTAYSYYATDTGTRCQYSCNSGYHYNGVNGCAANQCYYDTNPANGVLWLGENVQAPIPTDGMVSCSASDTATTKCEIGCNAGYKCNTTNDGCVVATSPNACATLPGHASWCPGDTSSVPDVDNGKFYYGICDNTHKCQIYCNDPWYPEWNGSSCYLPYGQCPPGYTWDSSDGSCI
jgi:hypothetical protein